MDEKQIEFLKGEFKVMHLEPGDIIVLKHPARLSKEEFKNIEESARQTISGHKIIVLEEGMDIGAIHPEGAS